MTTLDEQTLLNACRDYPEQLIFIMGSHRSGTTFLHNLLAQTGAFDFVSAYEVIHYGELLSNRAAGREAEAKAGLQSALREDVGETRGLDHVRVDVNLPEEYGFLLPGYDLFVPRLTEEHAGAFQDLLKKKRSLAGERRRLLLKEPNEFYGNLAGVLGLYPGALYVFNHRHPLAVLQSHVTSWTSVYEKENPYLMRLNPRYREIMNDPMQRMHHRLYMHTKDAVEFILNHLAEGCRHYLETVDRFPAGQRCVVKYEDVLYCPEATLSRLASFLGLEAGRLDVAAISPRPARISPLVRDVYTERMDAFGAYRDALGYPDYP